jgi:DNA-nicking Smr family endonuclease
VSKSGRGLTEDDKKLWRRVTASVRARRSIAERAEQDAQPNKRPTPAAPPSTSPAHIPRSKAAPQDRSGEKRVRRGKLEIGGSLDLHGHNQATGHAALTRFLRAAQARGDRTVIVITGTGHLGQGILRQRLPDWLAEPGLRALVSGFAQAHRAHGGQGAFYVFLRRLDTR